MEKRYRWADIADVLRKANWDGVLLGDFLEELESRTKATDAERMTTMEGQLKELGERMDKARDELADHIMEKMGNWLNRTVMAEHLEEHATEQKRVDRMEGEAAVAFNELGKHDARVTTLEATVGYLRAGFAQKDFELRALREAITRELDALKETTKRNARVTVVDGEKLEKLLNQEDELLALGFILKQELPYGGTALTRKEMLMKLVEQRQVLTDKLKRAEMWPPLTKSAESAESEAVQELVSSPLLYKEGGDPK